MYMALYAYRISLVRNIYTRTRPTSKPDKTFKHDMVSIFGDDNATDQQNTTCCKPEKYSIYTFNEKTKQIEHIYILRKQYIQGGKIKMGNIYMLGNPSCHP